MSKIVLNPDLPDTLFSVEPPKGYDLKVWKNKTSGNGEMRPNGPNAGIGEGSSREGPAATAPSIRLERAGDRLRRSSWA